MVSPEIICTRIGGACHVVYACFKTASCCEFCEEIEWELTLRGEIDIGNVAKKVGKKILMKIVI